MNEAVKIEMLRYGNEAAPLLEHLRLEDLAAARATIGTVAFKAGHRVPPDGGRSAHEQHEVSLILEGRITLETAARTTTLAAGSLVHIPAGVAHASVALEDTRIYFMLIG